jgi:hypothetical protein
VVGFLEAVKIEINFYYSKLEGNFNQALVEAVNSKKITAIP